MTAKPQRLTSSRRVNRPRKIMDVMQWSSRCHEHFLPWRSKTGESLRQSDIAEAGISDTFPGYELGRTHPRFHLLVYPVLGRGNVWGTIFSSSVQAGEVFIAPAGVPFGYKPLRGRWRFLWFHLPPIERWGALDNGQLRVRRTRLTPSLERAMAGFLEECQRRGPTSERATALYGDLIGVFIEREIGGAGGAVETDLKSRLYALWDRVNANLKHPWNVSKLAREMGISAPHLYRLVKEHAQTTPMGMVTRLRMERAQELLILHDYRVRVISELVGYNDEFAFAVAFKRFSGVTPGQFRTRR